MVRVVIAMGVFVSNMSDRRADAAARVEPRTFANLVLDLIDSFGCKPTPKAYEVFFAYAAKAASPVRAAVDEAAAPDHVLTSFDLARIHHDHFRAPDGDWERQEKSSEAIELTLQEAAALIAAHTTQSREHQQRLRRVSREISDDMTPGQLRRLTDRLVSENDAALRQGADITDKLDGTRARLDTVRAELKAAREDGATDDLTGLKNARGFAAALQAELRRAVANGRQFSLCLIDIDGFQAVNAAHDHRVGDAVLMRIGRILAARIDDCDIACRHGGDEFAVIMPGRNAAAAFRLIEEIRAYIAQVTFTVRGTATEIGPVTASCGIAVLQAAADADEMLAAAAGMLDAAKARGGNCTRSDVAPIL